MFFIYSLIIFLCVRHIYLQDCKLLKSKGGVYWPKVVHFLTNYIDWLHIYTYIHTYDCVSIYLYTLYIYTHTILYFTTATSNFSHVSQASDLDPFLAPSSVTSPTTSRRRKSHQIRTFLLSSTRPRNSPLCQSSPFLSYLLRKIPPLWLGLLPSSHLRGLAPLMICSFCKVATFSCSTISSHLKHAQVSLMLRVLSGGTFPSGGQHSSFTSSQTSPESTVALPPPSHCTAIQLSSIFPK